MNQPTTTQQMRNQSAPAEQKEVKNFPALLKTSLDEIGKALPSHLSKDRMARVALTAFRRNPALQKCDPRSVLGAVIQSAQLGLEPDTLGRSYLVPYGNECQFIPGWKGLVDLVNRSGKASVWTGAVFEGDHFEWALGDSPFVTHRPGGEDNPAKLLYVYAIGRPKGSEWPVIEVWTNKRVKAHRDRYNRVGKKHYSYDNWEMYARKVVLMQVLKYMPMTTEVERAINLSHTADSGHQGITIDAAVNDTWEPPVDEPAEPAVGSDDGQTQTQAADKPPSQNQAPAAQSAEPAASGATDKQQAEQSAPVSTESEPPASPSGMQFDDVMDYIRTCPDTPQERDYCMELIGRFQKAEQQMLMEQFNGRFGSEEGGPEQQSLME